jgi:hypothetical protein
MKRTLAVLLILAGLGAYVYFVEIKGTQKKEAAEKKAKKLVTLNALDIDRLSVVNAAGRIDLVHKDGAWHMTAPISAPADESAVSSLVSSLTAAETKEKIEKAADLAAFGLQPPKAEITAGYRDRQETVLVGRKSPVSQDLYTMRKGEPDVLLVSGGLDASAERKPEEYRDKRLFSFDPDAVTAVTVVDGKDTLVVERSGNVWTITAPLRLAADETLAHGLAADIANLRASRFVVEAATPADLAAAGLKSPTSEVRAKLTSGATAIIRFGSADGSDRSAQVAGRPQIVRVADWSAKNVLKKANDLRDRRLFPVAKEQIAKLAFRTADKTITLQRTPQGWSVNDGSSLSAAKGETVDELLTALTDFRATEFKAATPRELKDKQLAPPLRTITAFDAAGARLAVLGFGMEEEGWAVWAQTADATSMAKASNDFVKNKWPGAAAAFAEPVTK